MDRRSNFNQFDAQSKENADEGQQGEESIFGKIRKTISNLFSINNEDGRDERRQVIYPSYINENEHIYDAPSLLNYQNDHHEPGERNIPSRGDQHNQSMNIYSEKQGRRFSLDSSRTNGTKKKINPIIKITTYIANKKFHDKKKFDDSASHMSNKKSAFKLLDKQHKEIALDTRKMINYKDFFEVLKDKNISKPVPVRKEGDANFRAISKKRPREKESDQSMEYDRLSQFFKKRRMDDERSVFSNSINNINKLKDFQRDDVSMHSINSVLASNKDRKVEHHGDVSMHIRPETKSVLSKSIKSKTLDDIRMEIEMKRSANKKMLDEISRKSSSRRSEQFAGMDYQERKKVLTDYYQGKDKKLSDIELIGPGMIKPNLPSSTYNMMKDRNFSLTKSTLSIPSTQSPPKKKESAVVVEKKEQIQITPMAEPSKNGKIDHSSIFGTKGPELNKITEINKPEIKLSAPITVQELAKKEEPKLCGSLFSSQPALDEKKNLSTDKKEPEKEEKKVDSLFSFTKKPEESSQPSFFQNTTPPTVNLTTSIPNVTQPKLFDNKGFGFFDKPKETSTSSLFDSGANVTFGSVTPPISSNTTPTFASLDNKVNFGFKNGETKADDKKDEKEEKKEEPKTFGLFANKLQEEPQENSPLPKKEEADKGKPFTSPFSSNPNKDSETKPESKSPLPGGLFSPLGNQTNLTPTPSINPPINLNNPFLPSSLGAKKEDKQEEKKEEPPKPASNIFGGLSSNTLSTPISLSTPSQNEVPKSEIPKLTSPSSSNLCNPDNPFIKAINNPTATNQIFSSASSLSRPESGGFPQSNMSNSINFANRGNANLFDQKKDNLRSTTFGMNNGMNSGNNSLFPSNMQNTSDNVMSNDMEISPITSPKQIPRNDDIPSQPLQGSNNSFKLGLQPQSNLFGSSNTNTLFQNAPSSLSNQPSGGLFNGFNSSASAQPQNIFPLSNSIGTGNLFSSNSNPPASTQGGLFSSGGNSTLPGQTPSIFGGIGGPGLKFSLGKKDK